MAIETHLYLAPLVTVEVEAGEVERVYKTQVHLPPYDPNDPEGTYHWMESWPADDPSWRFVELTADEFVHAAIRSDPDIIEV